ncbi:MAG: Ig-like domain-containing protein, partial [Gammaproteobacteria bacterium]|nr:Ig-like domain-containing protein [Gammaproteobacteria bacterium]
YSDASIKTITDKVTWTSSNQNIATINNAGLSTTLAEGTTNITATLGAVASNARTLTVTPAQLLSIAITPANPSIAKGLTQQFIAEGTYSDTNGNPKNITNEVTWTSSNQNVATINDQGLATTKKRGDATITATLSGKDSYATLHVTKAIVTSIKITPENPKIVHGETLQFTAKKILSNGKEKDITNKVAWTSSDLTKATIDTQGLATSVDIGSVTITATQESLEKSGTTTLEITNPPPVINSIIPNERIIGETTVFNAFNNSSIPSSDETVITGNNFLSGAAVKITKGSNTIYAGINSIDEPSKINCKIPLSANTEVGKWDVVITNKDGGTKTLKEGFEVKYPAPKVSAMTPNKGPTAGGIEITITGNNFIEKETKVKFGSSYTRNAEVKNNGKTLTLQLPPSSSAGEVDVIVETSGGTSNPLKFSYHEKPEITDVQPKRGRMSGGTKVTITVKNFTPDSVIKFENKNPSPYNVDSSSQITATSPAGKILAKITVTTPGGTAEGGFIYNLPYPIPIPPFVRWNISYNPPIYDIYANNNDAFATDGSDLFIYNKKQKTWYTHNQKDTADSHFTSICATKAGNIYVLAYEGNIYKLTKDEDTASYSLDKMADDNKMYATTKLHYSGDKVYSSGLFGLFGLTNALGIFDESSPDSPFSYKTYEELKLASTDILYSPYIKNNNDPHLGTNSGYIGSIPKQGLNDTTKIFALFEKDNTVYASTNKGLFIGNIKDGWSQTGIPDNLKTGMIYDYYFENRNFYAATDTGLYIRSGAKEWNKYDKKQGNLAANSVFKLFTDKDSLYAATAGGLSLSEDQGLNWKTISNKTLDKANNIAVNNIGKVAITSSKDGVTILDANNNDEPISFNLSPHHLPSNQIDKIHVLPNGMVFVIANEKDASFIGYFDAEEKQLHFLSNKIAVQFKDQVFVDISNGEDGSKTIYLLTREENNNNHHMYKSIDFGSTWKDMGAQINWPNYNTQHKTTANGPISILLTKNGIYPSKKGLPNFGSESNYIGIAYGADNDPYIITSNGAVYGWNNNLWNEIKLKSSSDLPGTIKQLSVMKGNDEPMVFLAATNGLFIGSPSIDKKNNITWGWKNLLTKPIKSVASYLDDKTGKGYLYILDEDGIQKTILNLSTDD